jgi:hypothetical protein
MEVEFSAQDHANVVAPVLRLPSPAQDSTGANGRVRDSGWGRTTPDSLKEFQDVIWHSGQRWYPF